MVFFEVLNYLIQFADVFAFIVFTALGLAIIFGVMGVINLAHGAFIMIGAFATTMIYNAGAPLVLAMVGGVLATTVFGVIIERVMIRFLYDRLLDSMIATFGLSLIMVQGVRIVFGNSLPQIGTPLGALSYGQYAFSKYRILLAGVGVIVVGLVYLLFTRTTWGTHARATIQNEDMARSLGTNTERMYITTFALGSGLAGLTGALYAPMETIVPSMGDGFLFEAFVAVVVAGPSVLTGTLLAGGLLGAINAFFANTVGTLVGQIMMLISAIVIIRVLPSGLSGAVEKYRERRRYSGGDGDNE